MRCGLNELGYQVTKAGTVVYKRRSRPFTLKQIIRIFDRSFSPWFDESGPGERMDATGFFSKERTSREDLTRNFTAFVEETSRVSGRMMEISLFLYDQGPDIGTLPAGATESAQNALKYLIQLLQQLINLLK